MDMERFVRWRICEETIGTMSVDDAARCDRVCVQGVLRNARHWGKPARKRGSQDKDRCALPMHLRAAIFRLESRASDKSVREASRFHFLFPNKSGTTKDKAHNECMREPFAHRGNVREERSQFRERVVWVENRFDTSE